jgi:hypothetical protein
LTLSMKTNPAGVVPTVGQFTPAKNRLLDGQLSEV